MLTAQPVEYNLNNLRYVGEKLADLPYFIFYGTLLGYEREKSIIIGDDDIDIFIERSHREQVFDIFNGSELFIRRRQAQYKTPFFMQGVRDIEGTRTYVDFYLYEDDPARDYIVDAWNFAGDYENRATDLHVPKDLVFPVQPAQMQNIELKVPADTSGCCDFLYGSDWRTPRAKKTGYKTVIENHRPVIVNL